MGNAPPGANTKTVVRYVTRDIKGDIVKRNNQKTTEVYISSYWTDKIEWLYTHLEIAKASSHCWRCGEVSTKHRKIQKCHIIPFAMGGLDIPSNYVLLCKSCHIEAPDVKDNEIMWDWINAYSSKRRDNFWTYKGLDEYKRIYGNEFVDDIYSLSLSPNQVDKVYQSIDEFFGDLELIFHFGHTHVSISTTAGLLRMFYKRLFKWKTDSVNTMERINYDIVQDIVNHFINIIAELERSNISNRTSDSLNELKKNGKKLGRPNFIDESVIESAKQRYLNSSLTYEQVGKEFGISSVTVFNSVKKSQLNKSEEIDNLTDREDDSFQSSQVETVKDQDNNKFVYSERNKRVRDEKFIENVAFSYVSSSKSYKEVAEEFGVSFATVYNYVRKKYPEAINTKIRVDKPKTIEINKEDKAIRLEAAIQHYMSTRLSRSEVSKQHHISENLLSSELKKKGLNRQIYRPHKVDKKRNVLLIEKYSEAVESYMSSELSILQVAKSFGMSPMTLVNEIKTRGLVRRRYRKTS